MKRWTAWMALTLTLAGGQAAAQDKHAVLKKMQSVNRLYQVCLGRALVATEVDGALRDDPNQVLDRLLASPEATRVFATRLQSYRASGPDVGAAPSDKLDPQVQGLAKVDATLEQVLTPLAKGRHAGQCGEETPSLCFARWLVARTAPALGNEFLARHKSELGAWTYRRLLEAMAKESL